MAQDVRTTTICIDVPLKADREVDEERRRDSLVKVLYLVGAILLLALILFVAYRLAF